MNKIFICFLFVLTVLASIACVSAVDVNNSMATGDTSQLELSVNDGIVEDNLQTSEENNTLAVAKNDKTLSSKTDSEILTVNKLTYSDLRKQIGSGGNINLTKGTYTYNKGDGDTIKITKSGVINGNGAVIDMAKSNMAFYVTASGVTIKNLTIKNGNLVGHGGAIRFDSEGTVTNCNFVNNYASYSGGAISFYNKGGTVTNCNFTGNQAPGWYGYGGAISFHDPGTVTNCNFVKSTAAAWGGAIIFFKTGTVTNCNFTGNKVNADHGEGGAISFHNTGGSVTNCNFADNKVNGDHTDGGAIYLAGYSKVTNCNFTKNSAGYGGAISFLFVATGDVINCNFADNSAIVGGSIYSARWWKVAADTCIFKTKSDKPFNTHNIPPTLNVENFNTFYGSDRKLLFDLKTNGGIPVTNGNISISVYFKDNNSWVGNYSCLIGEGWDPDLPAGTYYAIFDTKYAEFQPINRTITILSMGGSQFKTKY